MIETALVLLAGHLLGDFVVQTKRVAAEKRRPVMLLRHGVELAVCHAGVILSAGRSDLLLVVAPLAVVHLLSDLWKTHHEGLATFVTDQVFHLLAIVAVSATLPWWRPSPAPLGGDGAEAVWWLLAAGLIGFIWRGGRTLVPLAVRGDSPGKAGDGAGARIGILERLLVFLLILAGQWAVIGFAIAAKSIARFKELESQEFADYYLAGTFTSLLLAVVTGMVALWARGILMAAI
jgi:hypothetical protein